MSETPKSERTEEPSPKKRKDALEKGQVPRSQELTGVGVITATLVGLFALGRGDWGGRLRAFVLAPLSDDRFDRRKEFVIVVQPPLSIGNVRLFLIRSNRNELGHRLATTGDRNGLLAIRHPA